VDFWRTIFVLLGRKSVALPVLLFPLLAGAATFLVMPAQYKSTATTVLTGTENGGVLTQDSTRQAAVNPLRNLDGMKTEAAILIQVLDTPDVARQLGAVKGGATTFTVGDGSSIPQLLGSTGPFIVIEGHSTSPTEAREIVGRVEQRLRDELIRQQRVLHAPPSTWIGMLDVVPPSVPETQSTTRLEASAGALVLGVIASMSVAYFAHRMRTRAVTGSPAADRMVAHHDEAPSIQAS
jgi:hypothetical protein